ncbi:MAG: hypothetical protein JSR60_05260 [Proteobacteria bacterium]|nr:hypothetical protein [Pseudomonadota bacterium]
MTDPIHVWKSQTTEDTVTLETIRNRANKFQRRIAMANRIEYAASALVVVVFAFYVWILPGLLLKLGSALVIAATFYIVWQLRRRGSPHAVPDGTALALIDFHRNELARRRDLARSAWRWYILPALPGVLLMIAGRWFQSHTPGRTIDRDHLFIIFGVFICALIVAGVRYVQVVGARKMQEQIDELDGLRQ